MLIYKITNDINDRIYIGQTTLSLKERIGNYKKEYKFDHRHRPILDAMRKYGWEHFFFEIVEDDILTQELLDEKEKQYIKLYKSLCTENGYNVELGGNGRGKHNKATKEKISKAQQGNKNHMYGKTGSQNKTSKPVIDLTTGIKYESANLAAQDLNLSASHICSVARGERGSTGNHIFRYIINNEILVPEKRVKTKFKNINILKEYIKYI